MRLVALPLLLLCAEFLPPASGQTATYTISNQTVTLTGLGGSGGVGQSRVNWGNCLFDGTNTKCTVTAPYTGVGGGGAISIGLAYSGNGTSPFTAHSISPGSDFITFVLTPASSATISASLSHSTAATVAFLSQKFTCFYYST